MTDFSSRYATVGQSQVTSGGVSRSGSGDGPANTYRGVRSLKLYQNEARKASIARRGEHLSGANDDDDGDGDDYRSMLSGNNTNKVNYTSCSRNTLSSTRSADITSTSKNDAVSGTMYTSINETPQTFHEKLNQTKVTSQTPIGRQSYLVAADPTSRHIRYNELASIPRQSRSVDSVLNTDTAVDSTPRSILPSLRRRTSTTSSCEDICDDVTSSGGESRNRTSPCSGSLPVIRRQISSTSSELETVGRTNIVSTVRQLFEDKSRSTDGAYHPNETAKQRTGRRSKSALGIVSSTDRSSARGATEDIVCGHDKQRSRTLDSGISWPQSEPKPRSSSTSGVSSSSDLVSPVALNVSCIRHPGSGPGISVVSDLEALGYVQTVTPTRSWSTSSYAMNSRGDDGQRNEDNSKADQRQHVFSAMTSGIRASWMRAILNCVDEEPSSMTGLQGHTVSSVTPTSSSHSTSSFYEDHSRRSTRDPDCRLPISSSSATSRETVAQASHQSLSPLEHPPSSSRWTPSSSSSSSSPPGRRVAVTAAAKLAVSGGDPGTRCPIVVSHSVDQEQLLKQQQPSYEEQVYHGSQRGDASGVIRGRATSRRTRPVNHRAESDAVDLVPERASGVPFRINGDQIVGIGVKASESRVASGGESAEAISSDTFSNSDSEDSTLWTHHVSGVDCRSHSAGRSRVAFHPRYFDQDHCKDDIQVPASDEVDTHRVELDRRPTGSGARGGNAMSVKQSEIPGDDGEFISANNAELSSNTEHALNRQSCHLHQQPLDSNGRKIEIRLNNNRHHRDTSITASSHVTDNGNGVTDDEKHLMINALTKLLAMKTEQLERLEKMATKSSEELYQLRRQLAQQDVCERCRSRLPPTIKDMPGTDVAALKRDLAEKAAMVEQISAELYKSKEHFRNDLEHERRLNVEAISNKDQEYREGRRLVEAMERQSKTMADNLTQKDEIISELESRLTHSNMTMSDVIKEKEEIISELEDRLTNSEKVRRTATEQLKAMEEECQMRRNVTERLQLELNNCKSELNAERQRSAELYEDVRHLRLEQMDKTELRSVQTKNALLGEDLERVEVKLRGLHETELELKANLEASEQTASILREQLLVASKVNQQMASQSMEMELLQSTNEELKLNVVELKNHVTILREKIESLTKEYDNENTRRRNAERKVCSLQDKNAKLLETNQSLKDQCSELERKIISESSSTKNNSDKMAELVRANLKLSGDVESIETEAAHLRDELEFSNEELVKLKRECDKLIDQRSTVEDIHAVKSTKLRDQLDLEKQSADTKKSIAKIYDDTRLLDVGQEPSGFALQSVDGEFVRPLTTDSQRNEVQSHRSCSCRDSRGDEVDGAERKPKKSQLESRIAEKRVLTDLEETNAALRRQLRDAEVDRERVASDLSVNIRELSTKLDAAERRNRRLTLQLQQQKSQNSQESSDEVISAVEQSYQRQLVELQRSHKQELDELRQEKDELLIDETKATQAVLDTMQKAHDAALEKERKKFFDLIAKTYCQADIESIQRQHEVDIELIQKEIGQLSEQYCVKCIENAALIERIATQAKLIESYQTEFKELSTRNDALNKTLRTELNRLSTHIAARNDGGEDSDDNNLSNMALEVTQGQLTQVQQELASLRCQLEIKSEELRDARTTCERLYVRLLENHDKGSNSINSSKSSDINANEIHIENNTSGMTVDGINQLLLTSLESCCQRTVTRRRSSGRSNWRLKNPQRAYTSPDVSVTSLIDVHPSPADVRKDVDVPSNDHVIQSTPAYTQSVRTHSSDSEMISTAF